MVWCWFWLGFCSALWFGLVLGWLAGWLAGRHPFKLLADLLYWGPLNYRTPAGQKSQIVKGQGCGIEAASIPRVVVDHSHFSPTPSVRLLGILPFIRGISLWEAHFVVSQKWVPFPTALSKADCLGP